MNAITDEQVRAFIAGCKKREPDCLDNKDYSVCPYCSRIILEIASEVLAPTGVTINGKHYPTGRIEWREDGTGGTITIPAPEGKG